VGLGFRARAARTAFSVGDGWKVRGEGPARARGLFIEQEMWCGWIPAREVARRVSLSGMSLGVITGTDKCTLLRALLLVGLPCAAHSLPPGKGTPRGWGGEVGLSLLAPLFFFSFFLSVFSFCSSSVDHLGRSQKQHMYTSNSHLLHTIFFSVANRRAPQKTARR